MMGIPVRQPLPWMVFKVPVSDKEGLIKMKNLVEEELNVKQVIITSGDKEFVKALQRQINDSSQPEQPNKK